MWEQARSRARADAGPCDGRPRREAVTRDWVEAALLAVTASGGHEPAAPVRLKEPCASGLPVFHTTPASSRAALRAPSTAHPRKLKGREDKPSSRLRSAIASPVSSPPPCPGRLPLLTDTQFHSTDRQQQDFFPCPVSSSTICVASPRPIRAARRSWTMSISPSTRMPRSACSASTAPVNRPCSASWPASTRSGPARPGSPREPASATCRRSRSSTRQERSRERHGRRGRQEGAPRPL